MNKSNIQKLAILLLLPAISILSGCGIGEKTPIVTLNNKHLYKKDFIYQIYVIEKEGNYLDDYYRSTLGQGYWDYDYEGSTLRETAKNSIMSEVVMYEILSDQALQHGITLSNQDMNACKKSVDLFLKEEPEELLNSIGLTRDVLTETYQKIALGDKYYLSLALDFKFDEDEIRNNINRDEYREYATECLYLPIHLDIKHQSGVNESIDSTKADYQTMKTTLDQINQGIDFATLLNSNRELKYDYRAFIYGEDHYEYAYQDAAINLKNGDYSDIVTTNYGYYIIHMLDNNSNERYEQAVEDAIEAEKQRQFEVLYNQLKDQYSITIHFDSWNLIDIGSKTTMETKK